MSSRAEAGSASPNLRFAPVTTATRADFEALFGRPGSPRHCWCMVWRATPQEGRGTPGDVRRAQMLGRIDQGTPVGLIAYERDEPVGWVSIAPKSSHRRLGGPEPADSENVWSLVCMFMIRRLRGRGLAHQLIAAAVGYAKAEGATHIEAYPVAADAPSYRFMGFVPAFERAGFTEIGMAGTRRHVMRLRA
jgi:GNAT superfamily N-acetyltransferase